jgi:DNA-binding transcriptional LysR family regulator
MDLDWLEDFILLVDAGGFSRAAERRGLGQPAFSRRISGLETWVGAKLIARGTHRVVLTPAGERFRSLTEEVLRRLQQARDEVRELDKMSGPTLRFACTYALSLTYFAPWLKNMEEKSAEQSNVRLTVESMTACEAAILDGRAQFVMCHYHDAVATPLSGNQFLSVALDNDPLIPITAPTANNRPLFNLDEPAAKSVKFLNYTKDSGLSRILSGVWDAEGAPPNLDPVFTSHASTTLAAMARDGRGVAWVPQCFVMDDLERGRLVRAGSGKWDLATTIKLFRPKARLSEPAENFWSAVLARAKGGQPFVGR